jgi:hypothetical protein
MGVVMFRFRVLGLAVLSLVLAVGDAGAKGKPRTTHKKKGTPTHHTYVGTVTHVSHNSITLTGNTGAGKAATQVAKKKGAKKVAPQHHSVTMQVLPGTAVARMSNGQLSPTTIKHVHDGDQVAVVTSSKMKNVAQLITVTHHHKASTAGQ